MISFLLAVNPLGPYLGSCVQWGIYRGLGFLFVCDGGARWLCVWGFVSVRGLLRESVGGKDCHCVEGKWESEHRGFFFVARVFCDDDGV